MTTPELDAVQDTTMAVLSKLLKRGTQVALVDFPNHVNAGDSLIFLGELAYLKRLGVDVGYLVDKGRYRPDVLARLVPAGPILLHGGGNFGDRWEQFQLFRERVISDFPDRQIIQLSQGVEFSEGPRLTRAQTVFNAHPSLTLLIRDRVGAARTNELFPNATVLFCPDMAFGVSDIRAAARPSYDLVLLERDDSESVGETFVAEAPLTMLTIDWGMIGVEKLQEAWLRIPGLLVKRVPGLAVALNPLLKRSLIALSRLRTRSAVKILSKGTVIVTDRLHATVYAAMLGKPVVAMPNANGKIQAIVNDYLGTLPGVTFAETAAEAQQVVGRLATTSA